MSTRPPPPSSRSSRPVKAEPKSPVTAVTAIALIATMLFVPLAIVLIGRSLAPTLDRLQALFHAPAAAAAATASQGALPVLRVRVVDGEGSAVAGASVRVVSFEGAVRVVHEGRTDLGGNCAFASIEPGAAGAPGARGLRVVASHDPEGVVTSGEVTVRDGDTVSLELALSAAEAIVGTVVDPEEHPVAKAALFIEGMPWAVAEGAESDAEGAFRLTTVPREASTLVVAARGYVTAKVSLAARKDRPQPAELTLRIKLVAGEPVQGDVTDVEGKPVRARVLACEGEPTEARTATANDGSFTLPSSALGCSVIATHDQFGASDPATAIAGRRLALQLKAGGAIEGVVVDERGGGVPRFAVGVETSTSTHGKSVRSGQHWGFEDPGGAFRIDNLSPGTYVLSATATGKPPVKSDPIEVTAAAVTKGVRIVLGPGGVVKGHVTDEQHNALGGVDLSFDNVSSAVLSTARATTDDSGAYTLEGAPSGPFTVRAEKRGFRARLVAGLVATAGTPLLQDITLVGARDGANTEMGGIGASLVPGTEGPMIRDVFQGDPAARAGLIAGDQIIRVDGESTDGMSLADVLQRLRGEAGTTVGVTVRRGQNPRTTFDAVIVRAVVLH